MTDEPISMEVNLHERIRSPDHAALRDRYQTYLTENDMPQLTKLEVLEIDSFLDWLLGDESVEITVKEEV